MGGFRLPASADAILAAVSSADRLPLIRLEHRISANPPKSDLPSILAGLTYVTARLHTRGSSADGIRILVDAALQLDVLKVCAMSSVAADAYATFANNLLSVDASYVEGLLQRVVPRIFLAPKDKPGVEVACDLAHGLISCALYTHHRRAVPLLVDALRNHYPHPVRSADEHLCYARALLRVARASDTPRVVLRAMIAAVYEKLSAIEALGDTEKADVVTLEVCKHIQAAFKETPSVDVFVAVHVDALFCAHEALIVPVSSARQIQYALLYALSLSGKAVTLSLADRFRQSFHDPNVPDRLRTRYLEHSATIIVRSRCVGVRDALRWIGRLTVWLNTYVDTLEQRQSYESEQSQLTFNSHSQQYYNHPQEPSMLTVDVETHHVFYSACAVLMSTLTRRTDVLSGRNTQELIARLRIRRILGCVLAPLIVIPKDVVDGFASVIAHRAALDVDQLVSDCEFHPVPTRTRSGARNIFEYAFGCPDLGADSSVRGVVDEWIRWDGPVEQKEKDSDQMEICKDDEENVKQNKDATTTTAVTRAPEAQAAARKRVRFVDNVNMVASRPSSACNNLLSTMSFA